MGWRLLPLGQKSSLQAIDLYLQGRNQALDLYLQGRNHLYRLQSSTARVEIISAGCRPLPLGQKSSIQAVDLYLQGRNHLYRLQTFTFRVEIIDTGCRPLPLGQESSIQAVDLYLQGRNHLYRLQTFTFRVEIVYTGWPKNSTKVPSPADMWLIQDSNAVNGINAKQTLINLFKTKCISLFCKITDQRQRQSQNVRYHATA